MPGVDSEFGVALLRFWIAGGSAALLLALCVVAYLQSERFSATPALRPRLVVAGAIFGGLMTWAAMDRAIVGGAAAERRALELRAQQLSAQVLLPGSSLAVSRILWSARASKRPARRRCLDPRRMSLRPPLMLRPSSRCSRTSRPSQVATALHWSLRRRRCAERSRPIASASSLTCWRRAMAAVRKNAKRCRCFVIQTGFAPI